MKQVMRSRLGDPSEKDKFGNQSLIFGSIFFFEVLFYIYFQLIVFNYI